MKKFISIMLVCFMIATLLPVAVFADDVIEIDTPEEFAAIADNLGGSYKLTADITITQGLSYGNEGALFTGTFDGNGHTITVNFENTNQRTGVFCSVGACTIKNLTVDGTITSTGNSCGGVVGTAKGDITFQNVTSKVTMVGTGDSDGSSGHGGILGVNEGCTVSFYNCTSSANITGRRCAGGFIGLIRNQGSVEYFENCVFDGTVRCDSEWSDKRGAGGFIGIMHHGTGDEVNVTFKNCQSNGTVTSDYILASAWVASYARWANADYLPVYDNCTQTAKVYTCGYEVSLVTDTRYVEAMDSQSSGKVSFDKEAGTVTVTNADMAMNADTVAAKVNAGVKVYVGGVLDESAVVTYDARRISVVSNDPTVTEGELISVILVFSDGSYTTLGQSKEVFNDNTRLVDFTLEGENASATDTSVNMNYVPDETPDEPGDDNTGDDTTGDDTTGDDNTGDDTTGGDNADTGDMTLVLLVVSIIAMISTAIVVNKRRLHN